MISEVLHSYHLHLQHLNRLVADLTSEQMVAQPNGVLNHPAWTLGHLIHSCEAIGGELGLQPWLPSEWHTLFGTGSVPAADVSKYADKHALLAALEDGRTRLQRRLV
ncbi:MAG: DinB family protein, partial [Planctomycetales bacterium]|nr:DinB family protein [Planctomycetales bacterium]